MAQTTEYPIGASLLDGRFVLTQRLHGAAVEALYLGEDRSLSGATVLVTTCLSQKTDPARLAAIQYDTPGVFPLLHCGALEVPHGRMSLEGMVESVPVGMPLCLALAGRSLDPWPAVQLAISVAQILLRAAGAGLVLAHVRPETIWTQGPSTALEAVGVSDRYRAYLANARKASFAAIPFYTRLYCAPEVIRLEQPGAESLSFTVATMLAEWLTGRHPFEMSAPGRAQDLVAGRYGVLDVSPPVEQILAAAFRPERSARMGLRDLISQLNGLSRQDVVKHGERP